jgi:HSP20 family protein
MNRLFEDSLSASREGHVPAAGWVPPADVCETAEGFVIHMDVPGVPEDVVEIQVDGDRVVVRGERRPADKARPDSYHRMERSYGPFARAFTLTSEVDPDRVKASLRDGLLRVELPRQAGPASYPGRTGREG